MRKSIKTALNKYLKEQSKADLEKEIKKLYTKFDLVKKHYEIELCDDTSAVLEEYKQRIKKEYFPSRGYGKARSSESRKVITEFKKISIFKKDLIELILCRVENMLEYTKAYGDINEAFYNSLESSYADACLLIQTEKLEKMFKARCKALLDETYSFGWGLHYGFTDSYNRYLK